MMKEEYQRLHQAKNLRQDTSLVSSTGWSVMRPKSTTRPKMLPPHQSNRLIWIGGDGVVAACVVWIRGASQSVARLTSSAVIFDNVPPNTVRWVW